MSIEQDIQSLAHPELVHLCLSQQQAIASLEAQLLQLQDLLHRLRQENEALQRASHRQAAPFSKGQPKQNPKPPGRKKGEGPFTFRAAPPEEAFTEPLIEVPVTEPVCPSCGGVLVQETQELATVTELPVPQPVVKAYRVAVCRCQQCGARIRGRHQDLPPSQQGASAHRLGERLRTTAQMLNSGVGIPMRQLPKVLELLTGVRVTQSALTQDKLRQAEGPVGACYQELREQVKDSERTFTDDTGWRIGGEPAQLMAFDTDEGTVYQIRRQHRNEEVRELLPSDYAGVMHCDRAKSYDAKALEGVAQQKCLAHVLRSIEQVVEIKSAEAAEFGTELARLLRESIGLWKAFQASLLTQTEYARQGLVLEACLTGHLRARVLPDPDNQRLLDQLGGHQDRGNLVRFLRDGRAEPTNNRAERALRPAVIARKVSQCSKSERGAEAHAAFMSVIRTAIKRTGALIVDSVFHLLANPRPTGPPLDPFPR